MEKNTLIWIDRAILALTRQIFIHKMLLSQMNSVMGGEFCLECTTVCKVR